MVAHLLGGLHEIVVEQQYALHLFRKIHIGQHGRIVCGDLREEAAVEVDEAFQHLVVFFPEMHVSERGGPALDFPARQTLRVAGEADACIGLGCGFEDFQIQRLVEKLAIHIAHIGLKQAVLSAVGQVGIVGCGQFGIAQFFLGENHKVVVQHAYAGHAGRGERPGCIQACLARQNEGFFRIGILLKHVIDDDLIHAVPYMFHVLGHLSSPHRTSQRIEDGLGGVVDDGAIELGAVPQRLAVQQQVLRVQQ